MYKKRILFISIFVLAIFFSLSCGKEKPGKTIDITPKPGMDLYGLVCDDKGNPLKDVVVSDGYSCALTDQDGLYQMKKNKYATQVNVSLPSGYQVPLRFGIPHFWEMILSSKKRYDFTLTPLPGGEESSFYLVAMADPQCQNNAHVGRFKAETVPDIAKTVSTLTDRPVYGITLGDIGWANATSDYNKNNSIFTQMRASMHKEKTGVAFFQVMGNHDNSHASVLPKAQYTIEGDIANQRDFENIFGPVNYSFNRGKAHIIGMDNIIFPNHDDYSLGFRDDQVEWLKQDLSYVPKDKMVILCVHIPIVNSATGKNVQAVLSLLKTYSEFHVFSGHTHYSRNKIYDGWYEHTHGAACGAWWNSTVNTDGAPNGYAVYSVEGNRISNWYYKGTGLDKDVQIRLHRGGLSYMQGYSPSYPFVNDDPNKVFANIWNADASWEVEVYENGAKTGNMNLQPESSKPTDPWSAGYHIGVLKRNAHYKKNNVSHIYEYTLTNSGASEIEIRAKDGFGNIYTQKVFTGNQTADYPSVRK